VSRRRPGVVRPRLAATIGSEGLPQLGTLVEVVRDGSSFGIGTVARIDVPVDGEVRVEVHARDGTVYRCHPHQVRPVRDPIRLPDTGDVVQVTTGSLAGLRLVVEHLEEQDGVLGVICTSGDGGSVSVLPEHLRLVSRADDPGPRSRDSVPVMLSPGEFVGFNARGPRVGIGTSVHVPEPHRYRVGFPDGTSYEFQGVITPTGHIRTENGTIVSLPESAVVETVEEPDPVDPYRPQVRAMKVRS